MAKVSLLSQLRNAGWFGMVFGALIGIALVLGVLSIVGFFTADKPVSALSITACTPESYVPLPVEIDDTERWEQGPSQTECDVPFAARNDSMTTDDTVVVTGQVCNFSDKVITYNVSVFWESISDDTELPVVPPTELTYRPGCDPPYLFPFDFPLSSLLELQGPNVDLGLWKLTGQAVPTDTQRWQTYRWSPSSPVRVFTPATVEE